MLTSKRLRLRAALLATLVSSLSLVTIASADVFNLASGQTSQQFVPVGDVGNAPDRNGLGAVNYTYKMGTFDVTAAQYTQFLNAVATISDPYGLYNSSMGVGPTPCGIIQNPVGTGYSYSVDAQYQNLPVNYVSWGDAARFANWLSNNQPTLAEGSGCTETGSYTLNGAISDADLLAITRNASATFVIPTEDEWYKAAYYDAASGSYWEFATQSNRFPTNVLSSIGTNNANYQDEFATGNGGYTNAYPNYLTSVGAFASSPGPYGTYDQAGDVWQWTEAIGGSQGSDRVARGGSWQSSVLTLESGISAENTVSPSYEDRTTGFRIAEVPEPASIGILGLGALGMLIVRRSGHGGDS